MQVFRIDTYDSRGNSHCVNRDENWIVRRDQAFATEHEAKEYVKRSSRALTEMSRFSLEPDFAEEFCFTNARYLKYRRLFIGYPPLQAIRKALESDGIHVHA